VGTATLKGSSCNEIFQSVSAERDFRDALAFQLAFDQVLILHHLLSPFDQTVYLRCADIDQVRQMPEYAETVGNIILEVMVICRMLRQTVLRTGNL
jgi:hypothetical protein